MSAIVKNGVVYGNAPKNTDLIQIINQASKSWVISDYMKEAIHYNCGAGTPEENGYSADDYNDENGYGEPYLDVITGVVYYATRIKDTPLTYGWTEKERLVSVQDSLDAKASKDWTSVGHSNGYLTTDWRTINLVDMSFAKEVLIVARFYANVIETMTIPYSLFCGLKEDGTRVIVQTNYGEIEIVYISHTQVRMKFTSEENKYIQAYMYAR